MQCKAGFTLLIFTLFFTLDIMIKHTLFAITLFLSFTFIDHPLSAILIDNTHPQKWISLLSKLSLTLFQSIAWLAIFFIAIRRKSDRYITHSYSILGNLGIGIVISFILKVAIGRARPELALSGGSLLFHPFHIKNYFHSMPSSHAISAFIATGGLIRLFPKKKVFLITIGSIIALTRLFLFKHFLSDLVFGAWIAYWISNASIIEMVKGWIWTKIKGLKFSIDP
ncbi:MAG: phosphatase PAP2 family protein [Rhabdochlamydiaceae bacterium]|nr:phosphatase PAP2 family protein [Candidatus Amphrikana amoebophyrae]